MQLTEAGGVDVSPEIRAAQQAGQADAAQHMRECQAFIDSRGQNDAGYIMADCPQHGG